MITPGMQPAGYHETEFFKLPFNELLAGLQGQQQQYDQGVADANSITPLMGKAGHLTQKAHDEFKSEYQQRLQEDVLDQLHTTGHYNKASMQKILKDLQSDSRLLAFDDDYKLRDAVTAKSADAMFKQGFQNYVDTETGEYVQHKVNKDGTMQTPNGKTTTLGEAYNYIPSADVNKYYHDVVKTNLVPEYINTFYPGVSSSINEDGKTIYYDKTGSKIDYTNFNFQIEMLENYGEDDTLIESLFKNLPNTTEGLFTLKNFERDNERPMTVKDFLSNMRSNVLGTFYEKVDEKITPSSKGGSKKKDESFLAQPEVKMDEMLRDNLTLDGKKVTTGDLIFINDNKDKIIKEKSESMIQEAVQFISSDLGIPVEQITYNSTNGYNADQNGLYELNPEEFTIVNEQGEVVKASDLLERSSKILFNNVIDKMNYTFKESQIDLANIQRSHDIFYEQYNINGKDEIEKLNLINKKHQEYSKIFDVETKRRSNPDYRITYSLIPPNQHAHFDENENDKSKFISVSMKDYFDEKSNIPEKLKRFYHDVEKYLGETSKFSLNEAYVYSPRQKDNSDALNIALSTLLTNTSALSEFKFSNRPGKLSEHKELVDHISSLTNQEINQLNYRIRKDLNSEEVVAVTTINLEGESYDIEIPNSETNNTLNGFWREMASRDTDYNGMQDIINYDNFSNAIGGGFKKFKTKTIVPHINITKSDGTIEKSSLGNFSLVENPINSTDLPSDLLYFTLPDIPEKNGTYTYFNPSSIKNLYSFIELYDLFDNKLDAIELAKQQGLIDIRSSKVNLRIPQTIPK